MSQPTRRMSGLDAVFVYAETPSMPLHTMGTLILDPRGVPGGFGFHEVVSTIGSRLHLMPPFRQRLLEVPLGVGHPVLMDDPDFRLDNHMHRLAVPAPGGLHELAEIVGDLAGRPLERSQPLWEMWVVEGVEGGRLALVTKMHHCMLDGASGSSQMASLLDLEPDAQPEPPAEEWNPAPLPSPLSLAASSFGSRFVGPLRLGRLVLDTAKSSLRRRRARRALARGQAEQVPKTPFNAALSCHRSVAYGSTSLAEVKYVKKAFDVTVNDVVLAACALSLNRYLSARDTLPQEPLACSVPISLKTEQEKRELSNKVAAMTVRLPTQLSDPAEVLRAVHHDSADAKRVFQAGVGDLVPAWAELLPPVLTSVFVRVFSDLDLADRMPPLLNLLVSNVMGPPVPLYFGGARVEAVYPMGPVGEGMGLNITVLSNMGRLDVGVLACRELVPEPWEIAEGFGRAVGELGAAARSLEAGAPGSPDAERIAR